ncbi:MAG: hypothetical protein ACKPJD_31510, partial [Planctomycetaceae bacterium]
CDVGELWGCPVAALTRGALHVRISSHPCGQVRRIRPVFADVTGWLGYWSPMFNAAVFSIFLPNYLVIQGVGNEYGDGDRCCMSSLPVIFAVHSGAKR